jgi:hypothetical protein
MSICNIAKGLAKLFQISESHLRVLIVSMNQTICVRHLHEDHPRKAGRAWFSPLTERTLLQDMYSLHTGDLLVLQVFVV